MFLMACVSSEKPGPMFVVSTKKVSHVNMLTAGAYKQPVAVLSSSPTDSLKSAITPLVADACAGHWSTAVLSDPELKNKRIYIAGLLHNNGDILYKYSRELLRLVHAVDKTKVHVSLHESGSSDDSASLLVSLRDELNRIGIPNTIMTSLAENRQKFEESHDSWQHTSRITFLAYLRNEALAPMFSSGVKYDRVLYLNDVLFCAEDAAQLILDNSHMTSGFDIYSEEQRMTNHLLHVYDIWVMRDLDGGAPFANELTAKTGHMRVSTDPPFFESSDTQSKIDKGQPFEVQCNWGGMVAIDASIFQEHHIKFRANVPGECAASECSLFCNDVWRIHANATRIRIDPRVVVAYNHRTWMAIWEVRASHTDECDSQNNAFCNNWYHYLRIPFVKHSAEDSSNSSASSIISNGTLYSIPVPKAVVCAPILAGNDASFDTAFDDYSWGMLELHETLLDTVTTSQPVCPEFLEQSKLSIPAPSEVSSLALLEYEQVIGGFKAEWLQHLFDATNCSRVHFAITMPAKVSTALEFAKQFGQLYRQQTIRESWGVMSMSIVIIAENASDLDINTVESIASNTLFAAVGSRGRIVHSTDRQALRERLVMHLYSSGEIAAEDEHVNTVLIALDYPFCASDIFKLMAVAGRRSGSSAFINNANGSVNTPPLTSASPVGVMFQYNRKQLNELEAESWIDEFLPSNANKH